MTSETLAAPAAESGKSRVRHARRGGSMAYATLAAHGEPLVWLTGGALSVAVIMIVGLMGLIIYQGLITFWPQPLVQLQFVGGNTLMGELARSETYRPGDGALERLSPELAAKARAEMAASGGKLTRRLYRVGNAEIESERFRWVDDYTITGTQTPEWGLVVERLESGRFYGALVAVLVDGQPTTATPAEAWAKFQELHPAARQRWRQQVSLQKYDKGPIKDGQDQAELAVWQAGHDYGQGSPEQRQAESRLAEINAQATTQMKAIDVQIAALAKENARYALRIKPAHGAARDLPLETIVRAYPANQLSWLQKAWIYAGRWWEFVSDDPRDSNRSGGYFPAIWGTVAMTLIMSLLVAPFGVLAAVYLREYAKAGPLTSTVRIAINNLAGVPSIVFGAFGLGFFCYQVGTYIDRGPADPWPPVTWFLALAAMSAIAVAAFVASMASESTGAQPASPARRLFRRLALGLWLVATGVAVLLVAKTPFFHGFFLASAMEKGNSTFGNGGLLWASLTLALLTAPVVIVATEEALAAVPSSMREGSYACGASKWQTIRRIVLPRALPGIMTGMILAMARGAGEVAPLMLVGVKNVAAALPIDSTFPYIHANRAFMHLAFMIYDVGYQSPDSEAARPMLYTTTLLLILIVACLNIAAIYLRRRLKKRFLSTEF